MSSKNKLCAPPCDGRRVGGECLPTWSWHEPASTAVEFDSRDSSTSSEVAMSDVEEVKKKKKVKKTVTRVEVETEESKTEQNKEDPKNEVSLISQQ